MADPRAIDEAVSWHEIYNLLCDYMRAQDRLIPELHLSVFHPDATTDYGNYKGSAEGFVSWAQELLTHHHANHHSISQVRIDFEGDVAFGEVYFHAFHRITSEGALKDMWVSGRYVDRYERRDGRWKIAHRSELVDYVRLEPAADTIPGHKGFPMGARAPDDLSCRREEMRVR